MPYFFAFFSSFMMMFFSEKMKRKNMYLAKIFGLLSVFILVGFATFRSVDVGTDVNYYIIPHWKWARMYKGNVFSFIHFMFSYEEVEPLYSLVQFVAAKVFKSYRFTLCVLSMITNMFMYKGILHIKEERAIAYDWLVYSVLYYGSTLNLMRQACAVSIVFYITVRSVNREISLKEIIIYSLFAIMFHRSSVVILFVFFGVLLGDYYGKRIKYVVMCVVALFPLYWIYILRFVKWCGFLPIRYDVYIRDIYKTQSGVLYEAVFYSVPLICVLLKGFLKGRDKKTELYIACFVFVVMSNLYNNLLISRISDYFIVFYIPAITYSSHIFRTRNEKLIYKCGFFSALLVVWYINVVYFGYGKIYPYRFV